MSEIAANNKAIKFPSHHYVGFQSRPSQDNCPLGFMTPDGTDAAAKKRKESVDKWATPYHYGNQPKPETVPSVSYENKPMVGFKLSRSIRRDSSFGSGNVKWRIEDPRGFELEISSPNFAQILLLTTMERGEIQEQMIWGRLGSENVLVPVASDAYKVAQENTARVAKKASLKDLNLGDHVVLHNGDEGTYMGQFYFAYGYLKHSNLSLEVGDKKRHVFKLKGNAGYNAIATPKIAEITPGDGTLTQEESEKQLNEAVQKYRRGSSYGSGIHENTSRSGYASIIAVTSTPPSMSDFTVTASPEEDFAVASKKAQGSYFGQLGNRWVGFDMAQYHQTVARNRNGFDQVWICTYDKDKLESDPIEIVETKYNRGYSYNTQDMNRTPHTLMPDKVVQYTFQFKTEHCGTITLERGQ